MKNNNQQSNKKNRYSCEDKNLEKTPASAGVTTSCHSRVGGNLVDENLVDEKKTHKKVGTHCNASLQRKTLKT